MKNNIESLNGTVNTLDRYEHIETRNAIHSTSPSGCNRSEVYKSRLDILKLIVIHG